MPKIKYIVGHEGAPVVEKENFTDSIFKYQYRKALELTEQYIAHPMDDILQIVAICGDRGFGKTSCMLTIANILKNKDLKEKKDARVYLENLHLTELLKMKFEVMDLVEPSFFDNDHNILELTIGRLYQSLRKYKRENPEDIKPSQYNNALRSFSLIREYLFSLHNDTKQIYNGSNDLESLTAAVELQNEIRKGINLYLDIIGKNKLIIPIDDIDLNMSQAYTMCEQIRKYLALPQVLVFMGVKISQLEGAIRTEMSHSMHDKSVFTDNEIERMARKYLAKFLPSATRVNLPDAISLCNYQIEVYDGKEILGEATTLKSLVVKMIFKRTRYLFYNNMGGVSQIVPNNLRDLLSLLGMLFRMTEITDHNSQEEDLNNNKETFKDYFFNTWTRSLTSKYREAALDFVYSTPDINLNKSVTRWLSSKMSKYLDRNFVVEEDSGSLDDKNNVTDGDQKKLKEAISNEKNFSFNVSVGDVFYYLNLLDSDRLSPNDERMLFFIKSYYSMRLYENYDLNDKNITGENNGESFIYTADERLKDTSLLQRLVGGSYFTYLPGTLLAYNASDRSYMDTRVIKGSEKSSKYISGLFKDAKQIMDEYDSLISTLEEVKKKGDEVEIKAREEELEEKKDIFRLAEFFVLTISRSIYQKNIDNFYKGEDGFRQTSTPAPFNRFYPATGYYVFDVLAPFANLINPKSTYGRFEPMTPGLYDFALSHDFSLLHQMSQNNRLKSDVTIRNGEVLSAIFSNAKGRRSENRESGIEKISRLYKDISTSGMKTHAKSRDDEYEIKFEFLGVLSEFLSTLAKKKESKAYLKLMEILETPVSESKNENPQAVQLLNKNSASYTLAKLSLIRWLRPLIGEGPFKGEEIHKFIQKIKPETSVLNSSSMDNYLPRKKGGKMIDYTLDSITDTILTSADRMILWNYLKDDFEKSTTKEETTIIDEDNY